MKMKKRFKLLVLLLVATSFVQSAGAVSVPVPGGGTLIKSHTEPFSIGSGIAHIDCNVFSYTGGPYDGKFVYTYQITDNNSSVGLSFFSVDLFDISIYDVNYAATASGVLPAYWGIVASFESVNASFQNAIGNGQSSAVLWFASDFTYKWGNGGLFGYKSGIPQFATGTLPTPIPEPATITLLAIAGLMTIVRKKPAHSRGFGK